MLQVSDNTLQHVEKFKYLGVVFTSDGRRNKKIYAQIGKQTQFCVSFIALWSQNLSYQTPQSCHFSNLSLFTSSPMAMDLG